MSSATVAQLADKLARAGRPPMSTAADLLRALPHEQPVSFTTVAASELAKIYERRARHVQIDTAGMQDLVKLLRETSEETLAMSAIEVRGKVVTVWLDAALSRVVGCIVGPDQRKSA